MRNDDFIRWMDKDSIVFINGVRFAPSVRYDRQRKHGSVLIGDHMCFIIPNRLKTDMLLPTRWRVDVRDDLQVLDANNRIRRWINIGSFGIDGVNRTMRPSSSDHEQLLRLVATTIIEYG